MSTQRLIQITDLHFREEPGDILCSGIITDESLRRVLNQILMAEGPGIRVLATGDLTQDPVPSAYERLHAVLSDYPFDFHCLPGNHDDPELIGALLDGPNLHSETSFNLGKWTLIMLDSSHRGTDGGRLGPAELERLRRSLVEAPSAHILLGVHHQPVSVGSPWMDRMAIADSEQLFEIIEADGRVRSLVFGHVHQEVDEFRAGARLLGTPSTCVQFAPNTLTMSLDSLPPAYRWMDLHADGGLDTGVVYLEEVLSQALA